MKSRQPLFVNIFRPGYKLVLGLFCFVSPAMNAQVPSGKSLISDDLHSFEVYGPGETQSIVEVVKVNGLPFSEALRINTLDKPVGKADYGFKEKINSPIHRGDVLWISFQSRCIKSARETGEAFVEVRLEQLVNGANVWPPYLERGVSFGKEWTETSVPFVINRDVQPQNIRLVLRFGSYPENFEMSPVTLINCGNSVALADLPRSTVHYEGDAPDAAWRKVAAERIEKYRKGNLTINVINADGKPVPDADVSVRMKRHSFTWGTETSSQKLLDTISSHAQTYRDTLLRYFNQVVFGNEMKWPAWTDPDDTHKQTLKAIVWLNKHDLPVRGHCMVWPGWQHLPLFLATLKNDTAALRSAVLNHINEQTTKMRGKFAEWDVTNELFAHHALLDILGREEMVKWYQVAHKGDPETKLFYNEYTMFLPDGPDSSSEHFYNDIKYLKEKGAPLYGIGEQSHIGGTPPAIPLVMARLDKFAALGYPIQISEFDITSNDDNFKARYMRDFLTAVYSNPATIGVVQWGFWEGAHWIPVAALWNRDWTVRENGKAFTDLVYKTWWTNAGGRTAADGSYSIRGYCGDYDVIVKYAGQHFQQKFTLNNKGGSIVFKAVKTQ